jgi:hypothetical protein|tara:strand:- start:275 stop:427 length:153 start_codon:yes stop_codon:yes gene_type:complete
MTWIESAWFGWMREMKKKANAGDKKAKTIVRDYIKMSLTEFRKKYSGVKK